MWTPLGRWIVLAVIALLLLAAMVNLFVVTRVGQGLLCDRAGVCFEVRR